MQARFYNMIRDDRHIFKVKESDQTNTEPVDIQMLSDKNNVTRPIIRVQTGRLGRSTNYVYLSELKRFYYIRSWTMDNGYSTMELEIDVLMTYRKELVNATVIVARCDNWWNNATGNWQFPHAPYGNYYLHDDRMKFNSYENVRTLEFSNGFNKTVQSFFLAIAGDVDNSNN